MTRSRSATVLALPAGASADEALRAGDRRDQPQIATEAGRFVFVGSGEGGPTELFEGFGEDAVPLGFREAGTTARSLTCTSAQTPAAPSARDGARELGRLARGIAFERTGELHEVRVKRIGSRHSGRVASGAFFEDRKNEVFAGVYFEDVSLDEGLSTGCTTTAGNTVTTRKRPLTSTERRRGRGRPATERRTPLVQQSGGAGELRHRRRGHLLLLAAARHPRSDLQGRPRAAGVRVGPRAGRPS